MERNGSKFLVTLIFMAMMMIIMVSGSVVHPDSEICKGICDKECAHETEAVDFCKAICTSNCEMPQSNGYEAIKYCTFDCTASICSSYIKDVEALKGCVDSCAKSCNNFNSPSPSPSPY